MVRQDKKGEKHSFWADLFDELLEEPVVLLPLIAIGLVTAPIWLYADSKKKKNLIKQYGQVDCSLDSFDHPISDTAEYIWEISERIHKRSCEVDNRIYIQNMGYISESDFLKELGKIEKDKQTVEFIGYHLGATWVIDSLESAKELVNLLHDKYFSAANELLEKHKRQEQYWK